MMAVSMSAILKTIEFKCLSSYDWYALILVIGHDIHGVTMYIAQHYTTPPPPPPHTHTVHMYILSCSLLCVTFPYVKNGQRLFCTLVHVYVLYNTRILAAATINFSRARVRLLIEGGSY